MGANINKVIIAGNLVRDVELRETGNGAAVGKMTVAVNQTYTQDGETKKKTEFIPVVLFGKSAINAEKFLGKGSSVLVEGKFTTRSWEDSEGKKRYASEVVASDVQFLTFKERGEPGQAQEGSASNQDFAQQSFAQDDDAVPF